MQMSDDIIDEKLTLELSERKDLPQEILSELEDGDILVKARSIHEKFLPEPWLTKLAKDSKLQRLLWRHKDPESKDRGRVYGRNVHNAVKDGFIESYYRVFGGPEGSPENALQELIKTKLKSGDNIGISKGFLKTFDSKNGEINRVLSLEDSITYKPQCKKCVVQEVLLEDMTEAEMQKKIEDLIKQLDEAKLQLEKKGTEKKQFEDKLEELEAKVLAKETEKSNLEKDLIKVSDSLRDFQLKYEIERKLPYVEQIVNLEKDPALAEIYKSWDEKKLKERLEFVKKKYEQPQIITTTITREREELVKNQSSEMKKDVGLKAFRDASPEFIELMKKIEKEDEERFGIKYNR